MTLLTKEQVQEARKAAAEGRKLINGLAIEVLTGDHAVALIDGVTRIRDAIIDENSPAYVELGHVLTVLTNVPVTLQSELAKAEQVLAPPVMIPQILAPGA